MCSVETCFRPAEHCGLCNAHYRRLRTFGDVRESVPVRVRGEERIRLMSELGTKLCSKCGETKPIDKFPKWENRCKDCINEYKRSWYKNNSEKQTAYSLAWRENNLEKYLDDKKLWYENNKERVSETNRIWSINNREAKSASTKIWRKNNPEKTRHYAQKRRALLMGVTSTLTSEEWQEIWQEFEGKCFWCGDVATTMEHIVPLDPRPGGLQGHHTKENVVPACGPCNSRKHNMDPLQFYFKNQERLKNLKGQNNGY